MNDDSQPSSTRPAASSEEPEAWIFENSTPPRLGRLDTTGAKLRVEFEDGTFTESDTLLRRWTEVTPDDFYFRLVRDLPALRDQFRSDPVEVIVSLLKQALPASRDKSEIQSELAKYEITSTDDFNAVWKKALPALKKHPHVVPAPDKKNAYRYTAEAQIPQEAPEDLVRELGAKATKPERRALVLQRLIEMPLGPVEKAWAGAVLGQGPQSWSDLMGTSASPDAVKALIPFATTAADSGDADAVRFLVEQATNHLQPAIAQLAVGALGEVPADLVDAVRAEVISSWTQSIAPGERESRSLQRVQNQVATLGELSGPSIGPITVAALLNVLVMIRDDPQGEAKGLRQATARTITRCPRSAVEAGAAHASQSSDATKVGLAVRSLRLAAGSTREAVLRGLISGGGGPKLVDPQIWNGATGAELVRLLVDPDLGPVLAGATLRQRYTDAQMDRFVRSGKPAEVLALLGAQGPLRECVPIELLTDRIGRLAADDEHLATMLDTIAGEPWRRRLAEQDATIADLEAAVTAAEGAASAAQREADQLSARVGELQLEAETLRRSSGPQARFDALRTVAEIVVGLAIWSTHPDRLSPADVTAQASQKAMARGLELIGVPGEAANFDPAIHELLTGDHADRVTIVEPGVTVRDGGVVTTLRYAKVQPADE